MLFKLTGTTGPIFKVVKQYKAAGFIPSVIGHTLDDKLQTVARIVDVDIVADVEL